MLTLSKILEKHHDNIKSHLYIGHANWDELIRIISKLEKKKQNRKRELTKEQVWTFLMGCGYAMGGSAGVTKLEYILTGEEQQEKDNHKIWFEVLPISPRKKEGKTHLDLAVGSIQQITGTESGIELNNVSSPWICFCEMKWYSDIDTKVTHDVTRNQLARVIENALSFQVNNKFADKVYVTLVTPKIFYDAKLKSRLYQYKIKEYHENYNFIENDIDACRLDKNDPENWHYPDDINLRLRNMILRWVTYDELFDSLPDSEIQIDLKQFWKKYTYPPLPPPQPIKLNFYK